MAIKGEDNRSIVTNFNIDGIDAVVGIDIPPSVPREDDSEAVTDVATGNLISPYHVLTAGHVVSDVSEASDIKVRLGENAADLPSRTRTPLSSGNFDASGTNFSYPAPGFDGIGGKDLALVTLNEQIGEPSQYIGLVTFVDPQDANSLQVTTAGFPGAVDRNDFASNEDGTVNLEESISKNAPFLITDENGIPSESSLRSSGVSFLTDAVKMFTATGTIDSIDSDGQFKLDETLDAEQGQSGSGYWTYLEGDSEPHVLGVYSFGGGLFDDNFGALITTEAYDNIVATMQPSLRANNITGNNLPENAIIGSSESDEIEGSYRRERILGNEGQDTISGGEADDRLEGGAGYDVLSGGKGNDRLQGDNANDFLDGGEGDLDVAVFSDDYTVENYDYVEITGSNFGVEDELITFEHIGGTYADGKDTLEGIEWAQFGGNSNPDVSGPPRIIPLPLKDGVEKTESIEVRDTTNSYYSDRPTPPSVSITAPVSMLDGDIDYTLDISLYEPSSEYNIAYIIDTSASMDAGELQTVKDAYTDLTNYYINSGIAENSNFGVVQFSQDATLYSNLTAEEAISTIQDLTASTNEGTQYDDSLYEASNFLSQSYLDVFNTTNIIHFVSGDVSKKAEYFYNFFGPPITRYDYYSYSDEAEILKNFANIQAFGFDSAISTQIDDLDSKDGVMLSDVGDLSNEFLKSGLVRDIESVNILLDDEVVETLTPNQLADSPMGLTYEGSIDGLDVSMNADNVITAEVSFTPESNLATTTIDYIVSAGGSQAIDGSGNDIAQSGDGDEDPFERMLDGSDGDDEITLGYADRGANGGAGGDEIIGNRRDNILDGGAGNDTISAYDGDDTITTGAGSDKVNGGEGIDTVVYNDVAYGDGSNVFLRKAANSVSYNSTDTLTDVEFIQFNDARISADTLEVTPVVEVAELSIAEGNSGNTTARLSFNLSTPAPVNVTFDYSTEDSTAIAGEDYVATSGEIVIPAGQTSASIDLEVEVIGDKNYEELEQFGLNFSNLSGATFNNNRTDYAVGVTIENDDVLSLNLVGDDDDNYLAGEDGNDTLDGGLGNDEIIGNEGDDSLIGNKGDDSLTGGLGNDTIDGGADNDTVIETANSNLTLTDTTLTGNGNDTLTQIESASLTGGDADNALIARDATQINVTLDGGAGNDNLVGGSLGDYLVGRSGNDRLAGTQGDDSLDGGSGEDTLDGAEGNDTLKSNSGSDELYGGNGNDSLYGNGGNDTLDGGAGVDRILEFGDVDYVLTDTQLTGVGNDSISQIESARLQGGAGDNTIDASAVTAMNVTLDGATAGGDDTLKGGDKSDFLMGRNGDDLLEGRDGNDSLYGNQNSDRLYGGSGDDFLNGGSGDDTLSGEGGNDTLFGSDGDDVFVLEPGAGEDIITDFNQNFDLFGLTISIGFSDLSITDNTDRTAILIKDTTNNNELLAIVNNVSADSITAADFTNV